MGLLSKSVLILLIAVSTPLLYRRFATEDTVKFMNSYYSNYKVIDRFLRQSASQLDQAKDYLPDKKSVDQNVAYIQKKANILLQTVKDKFDNFRTTTSSMNEQTKSDDEKLSSSYRMSSCPGEKSRVRLWSKEELTKFDGSSSEEIYLGFLGIVYNVTMNPQHYGPGAEYNVFAGRDATRAFITGNFTHDLIDNIIDIDESYFTHVESWASFYSSSYPTLGRIEGAFYDLRGCGTPELSRVYDVFSRLAQERAKYQEENRQLPECNNEWNTELKSGKVWCENRSGGIQRNWAGVPRLLEEGSSKRCVCVNLEAHYPNEQARFKLYPDCDANSKECIIKV